MNNTNKKFLFIAICFFVGFVFKTTTVAKDIVKLDDICQRQDSISYKDYKVENHFDYEKNIATVIVRKGNRLVARRSVETSSSGISCVAFYPLLGDKDEQLIIQQYTGGAHCCSVYWIYDLKPKVRLIFNGEKWRIGDGFDDLGFRNLDKDKHLEFAQELMTFQYFYDGGYPGSPSPVVVFDYDRKAKMYLPSNRFLSYLKERIDRITAEAKAQKDKGNEHTYRKWMLDVALSYIYAGRERTGWKIYRNIFGNNYKFLYWGGGVRETKKGYDDLKTEVKKLLYEDSAYRFLYRNKFRKRRLR